MSSTLAVLARHGVEIALALTLLLAIGALAVRGSRSPVRRHRFTEWTLGLALVAAPLLLLPLPRLRPSLAPRDGPPVVVESRPLELAAPYAVTTVPERTRPTKALPIRPLVRRELVHQQPPPRPTATPTSTARLLSLLFLLGAVGFALHLSIALGCLRRLVRRARPAPAWVLELTPLPDRTRVLVSTETERPFCFGLGRGTILLPASLVESRQRRLLRAVLLHEGAHLEQGHGRARLIAALAAPLFYWQPLYWWLARTSQHDAELVADELAAGAMDKRDYAAELLRLVESTDRVSLAAATGLGTLGSRENFLKRMETLLMRRTPLTFRESRLQLAGRTTLALTLLASVTLAWGHAPQDEDPPEGSAVPLLSSLPTIGELFQDQEDPTEESSVPLLSNIPTIGSLFVNRANTQEAEQPDRGPLAGEFDVSFTFGRLSDLLKYQQRCANEGGQMVITSLWSPEPGSGVIQGKVRVFDLTVEGKNRFLRRTTENRSPYPNHNPGAVLQVLHLPSRPDQALPPELLSLLREKQTGDLFSKAETESLRAWYVRTRALPPELQTLLSEIRHLEQRLAELEIERVDLETALATRLQRRDVLLNPQHEGMDFNEARGSAEVGFGLMQPFPLVFNFAWPRRSDDQDRTQVFSFNLAIK